MKSSKTILVLLCISVNWLAYGQQDPLYSQYLFNQNMINPAYTGVNDVFNATAITRHQWIGIEGAPVTNTLNVSSSLLNNKLGAGLILVSDKYGVNRNTEVQAQFAYRIDLLNGKSISFGMQTGYINYKYDYSNLLTEQDDQALILADDNISNVNFGAGVYYRTNQYYLGISVPRMLNAESEDVNGTNSTIYRRHFYISAGYIFDQLIALKFKPSILLKVVEGQPISIDLNASVLLMETLWVGATFRNLNAFGVNGQFEVNDQIRLGYSFELPLNAISNNAFGSHELMVSFDMEIFGNHAMGRRYF